MTSLLTQLESNQTLLLMYLAGELPPQDQTQVQRMLEHDVALREEMERLRVVLQSMDRNLADAARVDDISAQRAIRQTVLAMRAQTAARRREDPVRQQGLGSRMPAWAYPIAAAAILLIVVSVYLANVGRVEQQMAGAQPGVAYAPDLVAMPPIEPPAADAVVQVEAADDLAATFDDSEWVMAEASDPDGLIGAMAELGAIERLSTEPTGLGVMQ